MFTKKRVSVAIGDIFFETFEGKKSLLKLVGLPPNIGRSLRMAWSVDSLLSFNGLPHARLINPENDAVRIISTETLAFQETYKKIQEA